MSERERDLTPEQKKTLQRIATLQRMRDEAQGGNRAAMLDSIDKLLQLETRILREHRDTDDEHAE
jgi:hypothetical protein